MSTRILTMPRLGETMEEGTIVGWLVSPGQSFKRGQAIVEIETDKTVVEFPALGDGVLEETLAGDGDRVTVGNPIARAVVTNMHDWESAAADVPSVDAPASAGVTASAPPPPAPLTSGRPRATPVARRLARKAGLALEALQGTGRRGRIEREDVERASQSGTGRTSGRIAYDKLGEGSTTFLLIHGFAGDRSTWAATASGLARAGHCAIVPDLPAHGATMAEAQNLDDLVAALAEFSAGLAGPLHLVGHSLGAAVAVGIAEQLGAKAASLTLVAPAGTGREIAQDFIFGMAEATTAAEVAHLLRMLGPKGEGLSDAALAAMAAQLAQGRLKTLANALAGPQGQRIDILRPLAKLIEQLPVRALIGKDDRIIPPSHAFNLPSGVAVHFLSAGHMPHWDAPRETLGLLTGVVHG
ncbi:acetoin dehydrogenase dihydrolipoyllysine-residue acetyltransferase subunit [Taklimakanibacter lacteus]|uniref:acetoin dehydrogenase dihydrolipoyllysine-residue acetyltransferase subunit n=1 Tax=Taklimakanibacter lacteus TaxID=2268456 RepID=UPI000E65ECD4